MYIYIYMCVCLFIYLCLCIYIYYMSIWTNRPYARLLPRHVNSLAFPGRRIPVNVWRLEFFQRHVHLSFRVLRTFPLSPLKFKGINKSIKWIQVKLNVIPFCHNVNNWIEWLPLRNSTEDGRPQKKRPPACRSTNRTRSFWRQHNITPT